MKKQFIIFILGCTFLSHSMEKAPSRGSDPVYASFFSYIKKSESEWNSKRLKDGLPQTSTIFKLITKDKIKDFEGHKVRLWKTTSFLACQLCLMSALANFVDYHQEFLDSLNELKKRTHIFREFEHILEGKSESEVLEILSATVPEFKNIEQLLQEAHEKEFPIEETIKLVDFLIQKASKTSSDEKISTILYALKKFYLSEAISKFNKIIISHFRDIVEKELKDSPYSPLSTYTQHLKEYCYPFCSFCELFQKTFVDDQQEEDAFRIGCQELSRFNEKGFKNFCELYSLCYKALLPYTKENSAFTKNYFSQNPLCAIDGIPFEEKHFTEKRESVSTDKKPQAPTKKKKKKKKRSKKIIHCIEEHETDIQVDSTGKEEEEEEEKKIEATEEKKQPSPRSLSWKLKYDPRVLAWHYNPYYAYELHKEQDKKRRGDQAIPYPEEETIIRHRIPFCIEQDFEHLALEDEYVSECGTKYHVLNFPGAIKAPGKNLIVGYFSIGYNEEGIFHRFFHDKAKGEMRKTLQERRAYSPSEELSGALHDRETPISPTPQGYIITEEEGQIKIRDQFDVEYILFKNI